MKVLSRGWLFSCIVKRKEAKRPLSKRDSNIFAKFGGAFVKRIPYQISDNVLVRKFLSQIKNHRFYDFYHSVISFGKITNSIVH